MSYRLLKSATSAAKKKNNPISEVVFLTGNELDSIPKQNTPKARSVAVSQQTEQFAGIKAPIEKTPSVKDTLSRINAIGKDIVSKETEVNDTGFVEYTQSQNKNNISLDELQIQYSAYIEKLQTEQPRFYSALKLMSPQLDGNNIILKFQSKTLLEEYKMRVRPSLLSFFNKAFETNLIDIKEEVTESELVEKPKLYSDSEKLQHMMSKNPALQKLKSKFNLDFD